MLTSEMLLFTIFWNASITITIIMVMEVHADAAAIAPSNFMSQRKLHFSIFSQTVLTCKQCVKKMIYCVYTCLCIYVLYINYCI